MLFGQKQIVVVAFILFSELYSNNKLLKHAAAKTIP